MMDFWFIAAAISLLVLGFVAALLFLLLRGARAKGRPTALSSQKLLLLAIGAYAISWLLMAYVSAEIHYQGYIFGYECQSCDFLGSFPREWEVQKRPAILAELVLDMLVAPLGGDACFLADPQVCEFAHRPASLAFLPLAPIRQHAWLKVWALIPAGLTYWLAMVATRPKRQDDELSWPRAG